MKIILIALILIGTSFVFAFMYSKNNIDLSGNPSSLYQYSANTIDGKEISFKQYQGKKIIIVNVASKCGYTPQYEDLQILWSNYKNKNLP